MRSTSLDDRAGTLDPLLACDTARWTLMRHFDELNQRFQLNSLLTTKEAAKYLGLSVSTLNKLRLTGEGPAYFKLGRSVRYRLSDLDIWVEKRRRASTSDRGVT
jgi:excisionase family DNA binding protein